MYQAELTLTRGRRQTVCCDETQHDSGHGSPRCDGPGSANADGRLDTRRQAAVDDIGHDANEALIPMHPLESA